MGYQYWCTKPVNTGALLILFHTYLVAVNSRADFHISGIPAWGMKDRKCWAHNKRSRAAQQRRDFHYNISLCVDAFLSILTSFHSVCCRVFINPICLPSQILDPERMPEMIQEEHCLRRELKSMRREIATWYLGVRDDENKERWTFCYIEELSCRRSGTILSWESWKAFYAYMEGTKEWSEVEHSHRRTIAIFDEEIELNNDGSILAEGARHINITVSSGCWSVVYLLSIFWVL